MGDKTKAELFFDRMSDRVEAEKEKLTDAGNVPGTGLHMGELGALAIDFKQFKAACLPLLENNRPCTGTFNIVGGKSLAVEVSPAEGVSVTINKPAVEAVTIFNKTVREAEPARTRKVSFRPPGDS